ncbi:MAG: VOC family protein [Planctomycetes bacterium]|nr:VOC family protein [Planctomycetota bacterium]
MAKTVRAVPEGFNTVSAYLVVPDAARASKFYAAAFGAETGLCMSGPGGKGTMHAEMRIGDSMVMLADENPHMGMRSPGSLGGTPVSLHLYVQDVDALFARAVAAGCTAVFPVMDAFWGDRYGKLRDPFGHEWGIATHKEDLPPAEIEKRQAEFFRKMAGGEGCCGNT